MADEAAHEGFNAFDVKYVMGVPMTDYYSSITKEMLMPWKDMWKKDQEQKGKWYGSIQEYLKIHPWYNRLQLASRYYITTTDCVLATLPQFPI